MISMFYVVSRPDIILSCMLMLWLENASDIMLHIVVNYVIRVLKNTSGGSIFVVDSNNTIFQSYFITGTP